tara:strand:- start:1131 stop:1412 length:282 start_codon:yes stop_codon:yes gene_type:complete
MKIIEFYFFTLMINIFDRLKMSDNPFSRHVIKDLDNTLDGRKPIEQIKDEISELKVELIHIKNYLRKLEARESLQDDKDSEYQEITKNGWWFS